MQWTKQSGRGANAGFSMIELMIVVTIIVVISAMAAPSILTSLRLMKLRGATSSVTNMFERARMQAVHDNQSYLVLRAVANGTTFWYIDLNNNRAMDATDPQIALPQGVAAAAAPPSGAGLNMPTANAYVNAVQTGPGFNNRGLPCYVNAGLTACQNFLNNNYANFVYYLQDTNGGGILYMAVTISTNGKMRTWRWNGATWTS